MPERELAAALDRAAKVNEARRLDRHDDQGTGLGDAVQLVEPVHAHVLGKVREHRIGVNQVKIARAIGRLAIGFGDGGGGRHHGAAAYVDHQRHHIATVDMAIRHVAGEETGDAAPADAKVEDARIGQRAAVCRRVMRLHVLVELAGLTQGLLVARADDHRLQRRIREGCKLNAINDGFVDRTDERLDPFLVRQTGEPIEKLRHCVTFLSCDRCGTVSSETAPRRPLWFVWSRRIARPFLFVLFFP
ncbi:MAG: hypothetical protein MUE84_03160 [Hyphomonas sp.]|nr:hypothetical protein [Hyphomonas sp.]